jgi:hypothetical protein
MDQNHERRRGHFHRGRRGPDRRGFDRRTPPSEQPARESRDNVDVEQLMREIRAKIAQRHGSDLSTQQIQELAARRLEAILDPRTIKPALLDEMRRVAGTPAAAVPGTAVEPAYAFDEDTIFESHRGVLRLIRRLLKPFLRLFFNPTPIARALSTQATLNVEAAQREVQREQRQVEWNALQYQIVQRLVTEVSRVSIELQALSGRIESLAAKVDFNERRVRGMEGAMHQPRTGRQPESVAVSGPSVQSTASQVESTEGGVPGTPAQSGESARRRRRRRRGRRGGGIPGEAPTVVQDATGAAAEPVPAATAAEASLEPAADAFEEFAPAETTTERDERADTVPSRQDTEPAEQ